MIENICIYLTFRYISRGKNIKQFAGVFLCFLFRYLNRWRPNICKLKNLICPYKLMKIKILMI